MKNQSLSSTNGLRKQKVRYSQPSLSGLEKHVRYSRHLSFQEERISSNGRCRLVIHTTIRSPKNNRRPKENKSIDPDHDLHSISTILTTRYRQDKARYTNGIPNLAEEATQSSTRSLNVAKDSRRHQSVPNLVYNNWNNRGVIGSSRGQNAKMNNNVGAVLERQHFPSSSNRGFTNNNSSLFQDHRATTIKKELYSNTKNFHEDSTKNKRKRKRYLGGCPYSYPCLLASLLTTILLGIAIAAALMAILIKPQTTTTTVITTIASTTTATTMTSTTITTVFSTTTTSTITSTTMTSTITTTTTSTTSTSITATTTSCSTPTSTIFYYNGAPTSYTVETYNFTASLTTTVALEFGFASSAANKYGFLDDVSVIDTSASNSEMLINGDFENGSLAGWQVICTSNCAATPGALSSSSCFTGFYCYTDACKSGLDFLRQTFTTTIGHVYTLSFCVLVDSHQDVYVSIF